MTKVLRMITVVQAVVLRLLGTTPLHIWLPLCKLSTPPRLAPSTPQSCDRYELSRRAILRPPNTYDRTSSSSGSSLDLRANSERRRHPTNVSLQVLHRQSSLLTELTYECHDFPLVLLSLDRLLVLCIWDARVFTHAVIVCCLVI
jgi:hypothetical protein